MERGNTGKIFYLIGKSCSEQEEQKEKEQVEGGEGSIKQRWKEKRRQKVLEPWGHREHQGQDYSAEGPR